MLNKLIYPLFVRPGKRVREKIPALPGIYRFSADTISREVRELYGLGIRNILLFGQSNQKDWRGGAAVKENNLIAQVVRTLRRSFPEIVIITDVCLCAYTRHGHCGVIRSGGRKILHQPTLKALSKMALSHAAAGADYVAPSAMARGQVLAIRKALDKGGNKGTRIMGYSAKFASSFYGPFREACKSRPGFADRSGYQLDYSDAASAIDRIGQDIKEGADIVMVKPALAYLDIIQQAKRAFRQALAAYNVSGEYAFIKDGARRGLWDEKKIVIEVITSIKRAGADLIITYHAKDIARWLKEK